MRLNLTSPGGLAVPIRAIRQATQDLPQIYDAIGQIAVTNTIERFEREEAPDGSPWQPSIRVRETGGKTLQLSGGVKDSINHQVEQDGVFIGTPFGWVVIHQEGGIIRAKNAPYLMFALPGGGFAKVKEVSIPQREVFGVSSEDEEDFEELLDAHYRGYLQ